jgi:predicted phage tail protein
MSGKTATTTVKLSRRALYVLVAAFTTLGGGMFSTAAFAAGVHSFDLLAMLFAMGASLALFTLLVWYILQMRSSALSDEQSGAHLR